MRTLKSVILLVGVLSIKALLFGVCIRAPKFWKLPCKFRFGRPCEELARWGTHGNPLVGAGRSTRYGLPREQGMILGFWCEHLGPRLQHVDLTKTGLVGVVASGI